MLKNAVLAKCLGECGRRQMMRIRMPIAAGNAIASIRQRINVEKTHAGSQRPLFQRCIEYPEEVDKSVCHILRQRVQLDIGGRHAGGNQPMSVASGHPGNIAKVGF